MPGTPSKRAEPGRGAILQAACVCSYNSAQEITTITPDVRTAQEITSATDGPVTVDKLGSSLEKEKTETTEWRLSVASVYLGGSLEVGTWKDQPGYSVYELQYMKIDDQSQGNIEQFHVAHGLRLMDRMNFLCGLDSVSSLVSCSVHPRQRLPLAEVITWTLLIRLPLRQTRSGGSAALHSGHRWIDVRPGRRVSAMA
jgi:hypothetical protein